MSCSNLLSNLPTTLEGPAWKRGRLFKGWSVRHMVLKSNILLLYKGAPPTNDTKRKPSTTICLHLYEARMQPTIKCPHGAVIELIHPHKRSYFLAIPPQPQPQQQQQQQQPQQQPQPEEIKNESPVQPEEPLQPRPRHAHHHSHARHPPTVNSWIRHINLAAAFTGLSDFKRLRKLGAGGYGEVFLAEHTASHHLYAVKMVPKDINALSQDGQCDMGPLNSTFKARREQRHVNYVVNERAALQTLHHPNIVAMNFAFQDHVAWYLCLEFCQGGELFGLAQKFHNFRFPESCVRVWAAQLVSALECMHRHHLVHRDLKPENVLLDAQGHVKLIDFGFTKHLEPCTRTNTFCGTKYYIAPEMLRAERSYDESVDWWALGVLLYELLVGCPPFYDQNRAQLYHKILHNEVRFPDGLDVSMDARSLIRELLKKVPSQRIGCRPNPNEHKEAQAQPQAQPQAQSESDHQEVNAQSTAAQVPTEIRTHPFFKTINWNLVETGHMESPWIPEASKLKPQGEATVVGKSSEAVDGEIKTPDLVRNVSHPHLDDYSLNSSSNDRDDDEHSMMHIDGYSFVEETLAPTLLPPHLTHTLPLATSFSTMSSLSTQSDACEQQPSQQQQQQQNQPQQSQQPQQPPPHQRLSQQPSGALSTGRSSAASVSGDDVSNLGIVGIGIGFGVGVGKHQNQPAAGVNGLKDLEVPKSGLTTPSPDFVTKSLQLHHDHICQHL